MDTHPVRALAHHWPRSWSRGTLVVVLAVFAVNTLVHTVAGGVPTTSGRGDPPQQPREIAWVEGKLDPILARARDRNVPLVVFACLADEPQNVEFRNNLVANAALARGLADALPMFASNGDPPPGAALTKHKELMDEAYNRWVAEVTPDGSWPLPEVLIVAPDGLVIERLGSGRTVADSEVIRAVQNLNKKLGGGVDDVTVTKLAALRDAAAELLVATLERDKRFKARLPTLRLTEEAEDLLFEAEASLAKGDETGALRAFKKLAAKKYAETAAAIRARAVHAERMQ